MTNTHNSLLLVDDEPAVRESLAEFLSGAGFSLIEAAGEDEALDMAMRLKPSVVLSDLNLGKGSGLSLFARLKKELPGADEPCCILMTGFGTVENAIEAIRLGVDDYLLKPVNLEELNSAVTGGLARKQFRDSHQQDPGAALADRFYHEVSSPLTVLRAYLDMFAEGRFGPLTMVQESKMEMVKRNMKQVLAVLRGFHNRVDLGRGAGSREAMDPAALLREVQQNFFLDFERRGVHVVIALPGKLPMVEADRRQAIMVIQALVGNCLITARFGMTMRIRWIQKAGSLGLQFLLEPWAQAGEDKNFPVFSQSALEDGGMALEIDLENGSATLVFRRLLPPPE